MMNVRKEIKIAQDTARLIEIALDILDEIREDEIDHPPVERRLHAEIECALVKALYSMGYDGSIKS